MVQSQLENLIAKHGLTNVPCPLDSAYEQLVPETIQEAHEIQRERIKGTDLMSEWFITGDGNVYNIEKGEAVLYFTNTALNPVLKQENIAEAVSQIRQTGNYKVKADDFSLIQRAAAKKNGGAKQYALSDLNLTRHDDEWSFYEIDTAKYDKLNKTQRAFAEQVHGKEKQFENVMREMRKAGITKARVYVLNPEYVQNVAKDGAVARVGWLDYFGSDSSFSASNRLIGNDLVRVRGVRRRVAEGVAQKIKEPSLEQVLRVSDKYVPQAVREEFKKELGKLYE
jgi:DNA-binding Lrp family transcriptional regulator